MNRTKFLHRVPFYQRNPFKLKSTTIFDTRREWGYSSSVLHLSFVYPQNFRTCSKCRQYSCRQYSCRQYLKHLRFALFLILKGILLYFTQNFVTSSFLFVTPIFLSMFSEIFSDFFGTPRFFFDFFFKKSGIFSDSFGTPRFFFPKIWNFLIFCWYPQIFLHIFLGTPRFFFYFFLIWNF